MSPVIAISGELGSGKSSVARLLANVLQIPHFSTGDAQRAIAAKRGVSTLELNRIAGQDPTIDEEIDGLIKDLAVEHESFVIDSRMAWHFIPWSFKVHLIVRPSEAVRRVESRSGVAEQYQSSEEARRSLASRAALEVRRFDSLYHVRIDALRNYDLVVETSRLEVERVAEEVLRALPADEGIGLPVRPLLLLDPARLRPTREAKRPRDAVGSKLCEAMGASGFDRAHPIAVIRDERCYFVLDGHDRVSCALANGLRVVPAILIAEDDEPVEGAPSTAAFVRTRVPPGLDERWASAHSLSFVPGE